jgi:hypothetical protein
MRPNSEHVRQAGYRHCAAGFSAGRSPQEDYLVFDEQGRCLQRERIVPLEAVKEWPL